MLWRPAYTLLGVLGIAAAVPIFLLAPRLMPEQVALQGTGGNDEAKVHAGPSRLGYRILAASIRSRSDRPPLSGLVGDVVGVSAAIVAIALLTLATIPLAFGLAEGRPVPRTT
jgi:hypothetical protein